MARIAIITEWINHQVVDFAKSLRSQHHEIMLVTSALQNEQNRSYLDQCENFQVLQYFKKWSATEATKFFFRILPLNPEIWHFVFHQDQFHSPNRAQIVLANFARTLPRRIVASSFFDSVPSKFSTKLMVKCSDIVTTSTREDLMLMKRNYWPSRYCELEVLTPMSAIAFGDLNASPQTHWDDEDVRILVQKSSPYLFVPAMHAATQKWSSISMPIAVIFECKRFSGASKNSFFTGGKSPSANFDFLIKNATAVLIAFQSLPISDLIAISRLVVKHRKPIIANWQQAEAVPGLCIPRRNGFIVQNINQLEKLLSDNPNFELENPIFELMKNEMIDRSLNDLNRLYAKVRIQKEKGLEL